jgi:hypothetical protein
MIAYNQEKEVYHSGKTKPLGRSDISWNLGFVRYTELRVFTV